MAADQSVGTPGDRTALAARVVIAVAKDLRDSQSDYTVATITNDGRAHPLRTYFDRHSSAIDAATNIADTCPVLAYSVRQNADDSFTVYGGPAQVATLNVAEAERAVG